MVPIASRVIRCGAALWVMVASVGATFSAQFADSAAHGAHLYISADGRVVTFQSDASDLACGRPCATAGRDINLVADVFTLDRASGVIRRVSVGRRSWMEPSIGPAVDGTGTVTAFSSRHPLDARDDRDDYDLFVWEPGR